MRNLALVLLVLAVGGYFAIKWKLHSDVESGVDMAVLMMKPYVVLEYDGVSSTLSGELTIDGIRGRVQGYDDEFSIGRIGIDTPSFLSLMKLGDMQKLAMSGDEFLPRYFGIIVDGLRMPVDADYGQKLYALRIEELGVDDADSPASRCTGKYGMAPDVLTAMGYSQYDLSLGARFRQLDGRYAIEIESSSVEMWDVDAELILSGDMVSEFAKGPRYRPRMDELRIVYTDRSLNERVARYCQLQGLSAEQTAEAQLDAFRFFGSENGVEFDEFVIEPYKEFLAGKSSLIVTAKPNEPVSLSQISLYKPSDVPALLQLSAEAR